MSVVDIDMVARDNASRAMQTVEDRLADLRIEIDRFKNKGIDLTVGDSRNLNTLTREANGLEKTLNSVTGAGDSANAAVNGVGKSALSMQNLGKIAAGVGLASLATDAAGALVMLGQMGEESAQLDAKFTAISGSSAEAADRFRAMDSAVGGWLTRDEKMAASMQIMSLGLANSADEAANLAKTAIMLGDSTQSPAERIDNLTKMLATGQTRGLASYGLSVIAVRTRVDELKSANEEMSTEMATQQAITEAAAARMQVLGDYMPVTRTQEMYNATNDLKDSLANLIANPYIVTVEFLTQGIENLQGILNRTSNDPLQQLAGYEQQLKAAREEMEKMKSASGQGILGGIFNQQYSPEQIEAAQKNIDDLAAKVAYLGSVNATTGDVAVGAIDRQKNAALLLKDELQKVEDQMSDLGEASTVPANIPTGKTQIDAAKAVADLQKGLFSPEVIGAIDVNKLASEPGMAGLARATFAAFGKALAANASGNTDVVDSLLGMKANDKGVKPSDTAAKNAMNALAGSIGVTVKDKDFAGKMIGYGETIWGLTEEGMIGKAKTSTAFQQAIDAMVAAAIAGALQ